MTALIAAARGGPVLLIVGMMMLILPLIGGTLLVRGMMNDHRVRRRIGFARGLAPGGNGPAIQVVSALPMTALVAFGRLIVKSGLLPARTIAELDQTLSSSGFRGPNLLWLFIGAKIGLFAGLPVIALLVLTDGHTKPAMRLMAAAIAACIGLLGPDMIVRRLRRGYLARLERGVPHALDLMVICAQAGLGLEAAIQRVAGEITHAHREIAGELELTASELQLTADSRAALTALGRRTGLESLKRVTTTLVQTLQYGTPLTAALRSLAAELRQETLTRFEERATRLPVLLMLPMVLFILPCFFVIVGGPAVIRVMQALSH